MVELQSFTLEQLGLFITLILGSLSGCIVVLFKSRCSEINTPCCNLKREINSSSSTPSTNTTESTVQP